LKRFAKLDKLDKKKMDIYLEADESDFEQIETDFEAMETQWKDNDLKKAEKMFIEEAKKKVSF
jgi:hypothetical protein